MAEKLLLAIAVTFSLNLLMGFSNPTTQAQNSTPPTVAQGKTLTLAASQNFLRYLVQPRS